MAPLSLVYEVDAPLNQDLNNAVFAMLILGGHIFFPFMLLYIFISRNPCSRSVLFLHFCFAWVVHSVGFSILFYSGNATGPEPAFGLCLIQAVLVYIAPVLETSFVFALFYHLCFSIGAVLNSNTRILKLTMMTGQLITGPYIVSLVPAFAVLIVAMSHPEAVYRHDNYYCAVWFRPLTYINAAITGIILCVSMVLQFRVGILFYRNRLVLRQVQVQGFDPLHLFIRLSFFLATTVAAVPMLLLAVVDEANRSRIVFQAALPLVAFLTFGTRLSFYRLKQREETLAEGGRPPAQRQPETAKFLT